MWWRVLIPSWRFFDAEGVQPQLLVHRQGEWQVGLERPALKWSALLFNWRWSYFHACNNLLERLVQEISQGEKLEGLVSFDLVRELTKGAEFKILVHGEVILHVPAATK